MREFKDLKIAVAGTGYVGLSIATLLSQHHHVTAVDIVPEKVELINNRKSPIQDEYIEKYLAEKELDLTATLDAKEAYSDADFVVIAAPTNYDSKKNFFDTSAVEAVIKLVIEYNPEAIMVIKSTIPVGYTASVREKFHCDNIIFSPEFLRESKALYDNLYPSRIIVGTDNNAARIQVVVECLALAQELRAEDDVVTVELLTNRCSVTNRNGALNHHDGFRVILNYQFDNSLNCGCIKEILLTIVICRCSNDHEICIGVCFLSIQSCCQIQFFFCQIFLNVFVLNRRLPIVDQFNLLRDDIHSRNMMMLAQQRSNGKSYIACARHCNFQILKFSHNTYLLICFFFCLYLPSL